MNTELATSIITSLGCNPNKRSVNKAIIDEYKSFDNVDLCDLNETFEEVIGRLVDNEESQDYLNQVQQAFDEIMGDLEEV